MNGLAARPEGVSLESDAGADSAEVFPVAGDVLGGTTAVIPSASLGMTTLARAKSD